MGNICTTTFSSMSFYWVKNFMISLVLISPFTLSLQTSPFIKTCRFTRLESSVRGLKEESKQMIWTTINEREFQPWTCPCITGCGRSRSSCCGLDWGAMLSSVKQHKMKKDRVRNQAPFNFSLWNTLVEEGRGRRICSSSIWGRDDELFFDRQESLLRGWRFYVNGTKGEEHEKNFASMDAFESFLLVRIIKET